MKKGDTIKLAEVVGEIVDYDAQSVTLESGNNKTLIPRTKFQEPWTIVKG